MPTLELKPSHKLVKAYYTALAQFDMDHVTHETAVRQPFLDLLTACARQRGWNVEAEFALPGAQGNRIVVDALIKTHDRRPHGYWEAKDSHDDLEQEARKKFSLGYPQTNILFQTPSRALLFQHGQLVLDADLAEPKNLVRIVNEFFAFTRPETERWDEAVKQFKLDIPRYGEELKEIIEAGRAAGNQRFAAAFDNFAALCHASINPNLSIPAIEEMGSTGHWPVPSGDPPDGTARRHSLQCARRFRNARCGRSGRRVADRGGRVARTTHARHNAMATEIEQVIDALAAKSFSRAEFLKKLDPFYRALEAAAASIPDFAQKQEFLNTVYEQFFQGFAVKVADAHGIVYTPTPIVRFMIASVDRLLAQHFGKSLAAPNVHILDPFAGTARAT